MIECTKFRSQQSGCLLGFANLWVPKMGLEINDCTMFQKNGHRWLSLPSRKYEDKESKETKYAPVIRFREKTVHEAFQEQAIKAIDEYCQKQSPSVHEEQPQAPEPQETEIPF